MEGLEQFFNDNDRGYPRDPRRMAYAKLKKNIEGMNREQLEAFIKANLFIPHSQYKMALGNLIQFLNKQDSMSKLNEVKQFQKIAGILRENWHPDDPAGSDVGDGSEVDPEDFDDISETEGEGTDYDESSDSESDDTDAMGGINEDEPQKKGTLDQKEKIVEKASIDGTTIPRDWNTIVEYYREHYSDLIENLEKHNISVV
jgi:hypothetical protein